MLDYSLKWPSEFEDFSWEIQSKGWFQGLEVTVAGRTIKPTFYDRARLMQDMDAEISDVGFFAIRDLVVLDELSQAAIEEFVRKAVINELI